MFIDDIPVNVDAARSFGMTGIVFEKTDETIRLLHDLFPAAFPGEGPKSGRGAPPGDAH